MWRPGLVSHDSWIPQSPGVHPLIAQKTRDEWGTEVAVRDFLLLVGVEAATGFPAQPAGVDHANQERARIVLGVAVSLM